MLIPLPSMACCDRITPASLKTNLNQGDTAQDGESFSSSNTSAKLSGRRNISDISPTPPPMPCVRQAFSRYTCALDPASKPRINLRDCPRGSSACTDSRSDGSSRTSSSTSSASFTGRTRRKYHVRTGARVISSSSSVHRAVPERLTGIHGNADRLRLSFDDPGKLFNAVPKQAETISADIRRERIGVRTRLILRHGPWVGADKYWGFTDAR